MEPTNKQRRIPADYAELYSFNDDELELICKLRVLEEPNFVFSIVQSDATDASSSVELDSSLDQRECSSDTESTNQWIQFNQGFLGDDDRISDGMLSCASSMSQSYFTGMETDYDSDHANDPSDPITSTIKETLVLTTNASPELELSSENQICDLSESKQKRIVPYYAVESDESLDERDLQNLQNFTPSKYMQNFKNKISTVRNRLIPNLFTNRVS
ncbi:uncharacterized protein LOC110847901 [Folsomia candida]|uniref:uncharacterized protein LOC110847901 n=1 Tax=Folsomia candida TaxID=158441 RepID=UPI000B8F0049|nr:uncharacterized protein LOC110847901 [Folsomia candida]